MGLPRSPDHRNMANQGVVEESQSDTGKSRMESSKANDDTTTVADFVIAGTPDAEQTARHICGETEGDVRITDEELSELYKYTVKIVSNFKHNRQEIRQLLNHRQTIKDEVFGTNGVAKGRVIEVELKSLKIYGGLIFDGIYCPIHKTTHNVHPMWTKDKTIITFFNTPLREDGNLLRKVVERNEYKIIDTKTIRFPEEAWTAGVRKFLCKKNEKSQELPDVINRWRRNIGVRHKEQHERPRNALPGPFDQVNQKDKPPPEIKKPKTIPPQVNFADEVIHEFMETEYNNNADDDTNIVNAGTMTAIYLKDEISYHLQEMLADVIDEEKSAAMEKDEEDTLIAEEEGGEEQTAMEKDDEDTVIEQTSTVDDDTLMAELNEWADGYIMLFVLYAIEKIVTATIKEETEIARAAVKADDPKTDDEKDDVKRRKIEKDEETEPPTLVDQNMEEHCSNSLFTSDEDDEGEKQDLAEHGYYTFTYTDDPPEDRYCVFQIAKYRKQIMTKELLKQFEMMRIRRCTYDDSERLLQQFVLRPDNTEWPDNWLIESRERFVGGMLLKICGKLKKNYTLPNKWQNLPFDVRKGWRELSNMPMENQREATYAHLLREYNDYKEKVLMYMTYDWREMNWERYDTIENNIN